MRIFVFILLLSAALFVITGCDDGVLKDEELPGNFWAQDITNGAYYRVNADKLAENSRCAVWAEKGNGVTAAAAEEIANEYSNHIYIKMMDTFGWYNDIPLTNGQTRNMNTMELAHALATGEMSGAKLTILLLNIKDGYKTKGDPYVGGYFNPADFLDKSHSNKLDMIYVDTYPSVPGSLDSNITIAHEMQHLMNFVSSYVFRVKNNTFYPMDTWIDEGLSAAAEWVYSGLHPEGRWKYYNEDPSGLIKKGNNFYVWNNHSGESSKANLDDYATVYLFFQWLRLQSSKDIYFDIHTSEFSDFKAVTNTEVSKKTGVSKPKVDSVYNNNWPLMLRDWHAANFINDKTNRYGYNGDLTLENVKAPMVPAGTTTLNLYPGEGAYSRTASAGGLGVTNSGNIRYAGLPPASGIPDNTASFANGARLTYNVDIDTVGSSSAPGSTTGITPSTGFSITANSSSVQTGLVDFSDSFKVDAGYFLQRNGNTGIPDNEIRSIINKNNDRNINKTNIILKIDSSTIKRVFIDE